MSFTRPNVTRINKGNYSLFQLPATAYNPGWGFEAFCNAHPHFRKQFRQDITTPVGFDFSGHIERCMDECPDCEIVRRRSLGGPHPLDPAYDPAKDGAIKC